MAHRILVSAGESSGDRYTAGLVRALCQALPGAEFFGCAGPQMRREGVEAIVETESLSVVGLLEVLHHIPRIYGEFRRITAAARDRRPDFAVLTDSPDFHLRLARKLHALGIPVFYLVAPQAWAWRPGRAALLRRYVRKLLCIFPFEEEFFRALGVDAHYIGHPLARTIQPSLTHREFFEKHSIPVTRPLITVCPGSRRGEALRHLPVLAETIRAIHSSVPATFVWAAPEGAGARFGPRYFDPLVSTGLVKVIEGETWDALAHADLALAASGTVTTEAALLGTPVITFYKVTRPTWILGNLLVRIPFYSMVNLVAGRGLIPEFIQNDMATTNLAAAALDLLRSEPERDRMRSEFTRLRALLATDHDPFDESARLILTSIEVKPK